MTASGAGTATIAAEIAGGVAWVTLDRPQAANSRNQQMRRELSELWDSVSADPEVRVVVLTGAGDRFFSAGMDLKEAGRPESDGERRERLRSVRDIEQLAALPQPTIAAVNGYALGGGLEMALACDLRVVAEHAQLALTELAHGLVPGGGGTQRLPRLVGPARAAELLFTGRRLSGAEALQWGMANRCVPGPELHGAVRELAAQVAAHDGQVLRRAKALLRAAQEVPPAIGVEQELEALLELMAGRVANGAAPDGLIGA